MILIGPIFKEERMIENTVINIDPPAIRVQITVTGKELAKLDQTGQPYRSPFWRIKCDGLPRGIPSFNVFTNSAISPDGFSVGKTYSISGILVRDDKYFNCSAFHGEIENAIPGVNGAPKDRDREIALNTAMAAASRICASMPHDTPADAAQAFEYLYNQLVAARFWQEDHPTDDSMEQFADPDELS